MFGITLLPRMQMLLILVLVVVVTLVVSGKVKLPRKKI
jgi:hypothetical protein